jgi:VWFA-related protein
MKRALALSLCLLTAAPAWTAPAAPPPPSFSEVTDVVAVEVPVQVVDKDGQPVRGLTADDFEVYEGRKKQTVTGFEVLDLTSAPAAAGAKAAPIPVTARRHFLLLFDLSFSEPKALLGARDAAKGLVDSLQPSDLVAVAVYAGSKGAQILLRFTSDHHQIRTAIDSLGAPELIDRIRDPLQLVLGHDDASNNDSRTFLNDKTSEGRQSVQTAKDEQVAAFLQSVTAEFDRGQRAAQQKAVTALTRSFADLAHMMATVQGHKHVVYLSEGFDSSVIQGTSDAEEQAKMDTASQGGEFWKVDSDARYGNTKATNEIERMLEEFRRADCVIDAVDIGGLKAGGNLGYQRTGSKDSLFLMARETGGDLYENTNDLSTAMTKMLAKTSVTYVLTFQPDVARDGAYHKLRVALKNESRGLRVVHRPGYYAPRPFAQRSSLERMLDAAHQVVSGEEHDELGTAVLAAPFRADGDRAYVPVVIEVDGRKLMAGMKGGVLPAEIYVYALDGQGAVRDFVSQTIGLDLAKVEPALAQSGLKFFGHLDLPAGDYSLRVLVRNGLTGASGLKVSSLQVPAFGQAGKVLLPPFFPEPAGKWLTVREAQRQGDRKVPYPFLVKEEPYIPASMPVLAPGQEARLTLVGYNLGVAGGVKAESKVLTADGREVGPGDLRVLEREPGGPATPDQLIASFRPSALQPGEYVLLVTVTDGKGASQTSAASFQIGAPHGARG